jgi:hypothetical protein
MRNRISKYAPLTLLGVAAFIAVAVLPSSLVLPQTNPTRTLEYAPVPPSDENAPPPAGGNLSSLGLGSSGTLTSRVNPATPPPANSRTTVGKNLATKHCVGNPPRQTEDPLSPPCVPYFDGENFGATYQGVSGTEIKVIFHLTGNFRTGPTSHGTEEMPIEKYYDVSADARDDDPIHVRGLRVLQKYFNERYQTYKRTVRFFVYYDDAQKLATGGATKMKADAADNAKAVGPFAALAYSPGGFEDEYIQAMADKGILNFGSPYARSAAFHDRYPRLVWSYLPSVELQVRSFVSYVCKKVVNRPVTFSRDDNGKPRKLGIIRTTDVRFPGDVLFGRLAKQEIEKCMGRAFAAEGLVPRANGVVAEPGVSPDYAYTNMADFKQNGVTTVIWAQGEEQNQSPAAAQLNYYPEWVLAGNHNYFEGADSGSFQDQTEWEHAWVVSDVPQVPRLDESLCSQAFRDVDPTFPRADIAYMCYLQGGALYTDLRQLFTGVQVAGPRLNPASIDKGFHAIPAVASDDPRVPACFYEASDYSCVKDAVAMWWDRSGQSPNSSKPGCWRMTEGGRRYLAGKWPDNDVLVQKGGSDRCNGYVFSALFAG